MLARVLGEAALPVADRHAATLARAIQHRKVLRINVRKASREWRLPEMRDPVVVKAAVAALEEAGWLHAIGGRDGGSAGRQRQDYAVDPRVYGGQA